MSKLLLFPVSAVLLAAGCSSSRPAISADLPIASRYVSRGAVLSADAVLQPSVWIEGEAGASTLGAGVWGNLELGDANGLEGELSEVDVTLDHSRALGRFDTSIGAARYEYPNTGFAGSTELYALVSLRDLPVTPAIEVWYDCVALDGAYLNFNLSGEWAAGERVTASAVAGVGWMDSGQAGGYFGVERSGLSDALLQGSLALALSERVALTGVLAYASVLDADLRDAAEDPNNLVAAVGLSVGF